MRNKLCALLALCMLLPLAACAKTDRTVPVERADMLSQASTADDRYAGMVVSEDVTKITRDPSKTIQDLYVTEGQEVTQGQKLFSYDTDALKLEQDKQKLELDRIKKDKTDKNTQLKDLESQLKKTDDEDTEVRLKIAINTAKVDLSQLDFDLKAKQKELNQIAAMLKDVVVKSPVAGSIRKIDANDTDGSGAYITIQKAGAYRVKGTLNELSLMGGMGVGTQVRITSRVDETQTWTGVVTEIDMDNYSDGSSGGDMWMYGPMDPMTSSTSYPFYIELDSTEGLLLGQHVYIQAASGMDTSGILYVPSSYLVNLNTDEETMEVTASVWVASSEGKLESRTVTVGMFDESKSAYEILAGLAPEDFVADPAAPGCAEGAAVRYLQPKDFTGEEPEPTDALPEDGGTLPESEEAGDGDPVPEEVVSDGPVIELPVAGDAEIAPEPPTAVPAGRS